MATAASTLRQWFTPRWWWSKVLRALRRPAKHPFDRVHGLDTGGLIYAENLAGGHAHAAHNAGYYATAPSLFHGAIALWRETLRHTAYSVEDYTLVDIGCGKGRVLLLATELEFREIVGVEIDPHLAEVARKNLRTWVHRWPWFRFRRRRKPTPVVQIIEGDALWFPFPDGPLALFYFNSFERELTERWLSRLAEVARDRTAPLDLIYIHPEFDALIRQVPGMRSVSQADIPFTEEDAAADVFAVAEDRCAIYRIGSFHEERLTG